MATMNLGSPKIYGGTATKVKIKSIVIDPAGTIDIEMLDCADDGTCLGSRSLCVKGDGFAALAPGILSAVEAYVGGIVGATK